MILSSRADMIGWTLSPDDRSIGYVESWGAMGRLSIQPVAGGPARELTAALNNVDLAWSPDGERIVYVAQHRGELRLWTLEVETGATTVHEGTRASSSSLLLLWPTPTRIVYTRAGVGYRVLELESGAERALLHDASPGPFYRAVPSPDGQRLAVHWDREPRGVWTLDLERGDAQLVVAGRYYPTDWSADGRELLLFDFDKPEQLSRVDAEGGPARTWRATPSGKRRPICMIGLDDALVCGFESSERTLGLVTLPRP